MKPPTGGSREVKDICKDPQEIKTLKELKGYLCEVCAPKWGRGMPKARKCKECEAQCGYGRRLLELMKEINSDKKKKEPEQEQETVQEEKKEQSRLVCVKLTPTQCRNVYEFIEMNLLDVIRNDTGIDNVNWVADMIGAMNAMKLADW